MRKQYFGLTQVNKEGFETYLTVKTIKGQPLAMFTGNKNFAYTFESEQEAKNFFETYPWSQVPEVSITAL